MTKIAFTRPGGGVSVVSLTSEHMSKFATEQEGIDAAMSVVPPGSVDVVVNPQIPTSRDYRAAWVPVAGNVDVDMPKARVIHMDRIRAERDRELDRLDKEYTKEDGRGNAPAKAAVEAQRELLRNIPQTFDLSSATNPDELKALWPAEVPK